MKFLYKNLYLWGRSCFVVSVIILFTSLNAVAQFQKITGHINACQNDPNGETYSISIGASSCPIRWTVTGGQAISDGNKTTIDKSTDKSGNSSITVKWTDFSAGKVTATANGSCSSFYADVSVSIESLPLTIIADPSIVRFGEEVKLTAIPGITGRAPTYSWVTSSNGGLLKSSGNPVTAKPIGNEVTYTCYASFKTDNGRDPVLECTSVKDITVKVDIPAISGNTICCNQCILRNQDAATLTSDEVTGGNGKAFNFQWQQSTDGVNFTQITNAKSKDYSPKGLTQSTWFRRRLIPTGMPEVNSNAVLVEVLDNDVVVSAKSYAASTTVKAYQTITIQGDQTPVADVQVDFIAKQRIVVKPATKLSGKIKLGTGLDCGGVTNSGRLAAQAQESVNVMEAVASEMQNALSLYPNPSYGETFVTYTSAVQGSVRVTIVDAMGGPVMRLVEEQHLDAGVYTTQFASDKLSEGLYYCVFEIGSSRLVKRISIHR